VGDDYQSYAHRLEKLNLAQTHIRHEGDTVTAQAFSTTDLAVLSFKYAARISWEHKSNL